MAYTQAQNKATQKYLNENMEQVRFWVKKGERDALHAMAAADGISTAQYVIAAINEYAGREVLTPSKQQD